MTYTATAALPYVDAERAVEIGEPKTEKSRRTVPLPHAAVDALREHRKRQ